MYAGLKNKRITIQSLSTEQDGHGEPIKSWSNTSTVWAQVRFLSGKERSEAQRDVAERIAMLVIDKRIPVTTQNRVSFDGGIYDIEAVLPTVGDEDHELTCKERV